MAKISTELIDPTPNCDHLENLKFSHVNPFAFTEHGVLMLANVLNFSRAVEMSIRIIEVFTRMRRMVAMNEGFSKKLRALEDRVGEHDEEIREIISVIRQMIAYEEKPKRKIGFHPSER